MPGRWWGSALAGLLPLAASSWLLLSHGVGVRDIVVFAAYLLLAVLGPGILVSRAVLGRPPLLVAELGVGGVTGMVLTLPAWAIATASGTGEHLRFWPVVVYLVFAVTPPLRRHWAFRRYPERLGSLWAWVLSASVVVAGAPLRDAFAASVPLTGASQWPADLHWHLGLVELFARQVSPEDSQVAGHVLAYHWFANADMAAASLATGIDPGVLASRLWILPLIALTAAMLVAALREVGPQGTRGAVVAAVLVAAPAGLEVFTWLDVPWDPVFAPLSPSQNYSYPILLLCVALVVRYLRGGGWGTLVPLGVLLVLSPGAKASSLPILLSGLLLATAVAVLRRGPWRRPALLAAITAAALVVGSLAIGAGGREGAGVRLLATLARLPAFQSSLGLEPGENLNEPGAWLPGGLDVPGMTSVIALLFLAVVVKYAWILPGLSLLRGRGREVDLAAWVLFGGGLAGWLLMLLIDQAGLSQVYFMTAGMLLWALLAGWGTVVLFDRARLRHGIRATTRWVLGGAVVGAAAVLAVAFVAEDVALRVLPPRDVVGPVDLADPAETATALAAGVVPIVVALLLAAGVLLAVRRSSRRGLVALGVVAGTVAGSLVLNPYLSGPARPTPPLTRWAVSPDELSAARWIADHAGPHDIVATNVHCISARADGICDARAFWVSSLSRRRTFIGAWAYLDVTGSLAARNGGPQAQQPFHDAGKFAVNQAMFEAPTQAVADVLAAEGVDWLYADRRRGRISPDLPLVADLVLRTGEVDVYRLPKELATQ